MKLNLLISRPITVRLPVLNKISKCCYASVKGDIIKELNVEETPIYAEEELQPVDEEKIQEITNISGLNPAHLNILNGRKPYDVSFSKYHDSVKYKRRLLGRYGMEAAGVSPGIAWPTKEEIDDHKEYEKVAYPQTIQEIWKEIEERKKQEALEIKTREEEIEKVVANFDQWKAALDAKIAKKEAEILEAKRKKEQTLQEIRDMVGYYVDPRDERFQELLAEKEKEDRKKKKMDKKKKNQEKLLAYLAKQEEKMRQRTENEKAEEESKSNESQINESEDKGLKDSSKIDDK